VRPAQFDVAAVLAVVATALGPGRDVRMFDRVVGDRSLPSLGLVASDEEMAKAAAVLDGQVGIPVLDLIQLDDGLAARIDASLPAALPVT
jgi:hypothetical protein